MAGAVCLVKQLLFYLAISAVFRPISLVQRNSAIHEYLETGYPPTRRADSTSSVQELSIPVWILLLHYGSIETAESRAECRRRRHRGSGMLLQRAARHPLYLSAMRTARCPVSFLLGSENSYNKTTAAVFIGTGVYFMIILLAMGDVETNPGPIGESFTLEELSKLLDDKFGVQDKKLEEKLLVTNNAIGDLKDIVEGFGSRMSVMSEKIEQLTVEKAELADRVSRLEKQLADHEGERRRANAVVFGIPPGDNLQEVMDEVLFKRLGLPKKPIHEIVQSYFRIGKPEGKSRPVVIRFCNQGMKSSAMKNAFKLKGSRIAITDDLTPEERATRRELVNARRMAQKAGLRVKIQRNDLVINGVKIAAKDTRKVGWLDNLRQAHEGDDNDGESAASTSQNGQAAAAKKRNRQAAMLSPDNQPLEPQAGPSQGFATAPLNKKKASSQTKAVSKTQRGRQARSLERVTRSTAADSRESSVDSNAE